MTTRTMGTGTRLAVTGPGTIVVVALIVAALTLGPGLPARTATHFGDGGRADGWGSPWPLFWVTLAIAVVGAVWSVVALRTRDRRTSATLLLVLNLVSGALASAWIATAVVNVEADPVLPLWWAMLALPVSVAVAAPPTIALFRTAPPLPAHDVPPLDVAPDTRVAWRARIDARWFAALGVVAVTLGVVLAVVITPASTDAGLVSGIVLVVAGLSFLVLARAECTVDRRGLRLVSSWTRIPLMRIPLARIESCGCEQVSPGQWGGWGYRLSGRGIAYVVRSGPGLVVRLRGGGVRMVTVDDAERGAAALGAVLAGRDAS